jgi:hypothetical protein
MGRILMKAGAGMTSYTSMLACTISHLMRFVRCSVIYPDPVGIWPSSSRSELLDD